MTHGDQSGHVQGPAQVSIARFADAYFLVDRAARLIFTGVQTGIGHPLAHVEIFRQQRRLGQQAQGAGRPMPLAVRSR